jgi:shikimate dehydrogenase
MNGQTILCGIIGDPVEHSLSPVMHNAAFRKLGLNYNYMAFPTPPEKLSSAVERIRGQNMRGVNATIPHKIGVISLLDEMDETARQIGAVNTIVNNNGSLKGYNTDADGFMQALAEHGISVSGKKVILLGTGGAAYAIAFAVAKQCAGLIIFNRKEHFARAQELAENLKQYTTHKVIARVLNNANLQSELETADILVNATSAGMSPRSDITPVPKNLLKPRLVVFDIVYHPVQTILLKESAEVGCRTISGIDMLLAQGALSFKLWTGIEAPADVMRQAVLHALEKTPAIIPDDKKTSIALIGFMGSGKSAVGRILSEKLGKKLTVVDKLIVRRAHKPISRIFAEDKEAAFRRLETEVTRKVAAIPGQVIDCGGGIVLNKVNMDMLKERAVVVYLAASPEAVLKRVSLSRTRRPLLENKDKAGSIKSLLEYRRPLYEQAADITVDTEGKGIDVIAREIILKLRQYENYTG